MKQSRKLIFISFLIFSVINLYPQNVIISVDEYAPFIDSSEMDNGFLTRIVVLALEAEGITPEIRFRPWARVERELYAGECVSFPYIKNEERLEKMYYSDELSRTETFLITRKDKNIPEIKSLEDLRDFKIGITRGYSYGNDFDSFIDQLDIIIDNTDFLNIRKVLGGWIDIFPCDIYLGKKLVNENFSKDIQEQFVFTKSIIFDEFEPFFFVVGKNHPEAEIIIQKFNRGLSKITANGKKEEIINKAFGK